MKKKTLAMIVAATLVVGGTIGGTLAWLIDRTDEVTNTFTVGNIDIDLKETTGDEYKMIPGDVLDKDPTVTVEKGSEACWLFVKITESGGVTIDGTQYVFDDFIDYGMVDGWTQLEKDVNGNVLTDLVYYRSVDSLVDADDDTAFSIIKDADGTVNKVTVKSSVTKEMMDALEAAGEDSYPELTFAAYAVQKDNISTPELAWSEAIK